MATPLPHRAQSGVVGDVIGSGPGAGVTGRRAGGGNGAGGRSGVDAAAAASVNAAEAVNVDVSIGDFGGEEVRGGLQRRSPFLYNTGYTVDFIAL